jgi:hypothetical protein
MNIRQALFSYLKYSIFKEEYKLAVNTLESSGINRLSLKTANFNFDKLSNWSMIERQPDKELYKHVDYFIENHLDFETYIKVMQEENEQ